MGLWERSKSWKLATQLIVAFLAIVLVGGLVAAIEGNPKKAAQTHSPSTSSATTIPTASATPPNPTSTPTAVQTNGTVRLAPPTRPRRTATPSAATGPNATALISLTVAAATHADTYNRNNFGAWTDEDHNCLDSRAEVLKRDSLTAPTITGCNVRAGQWVSPWSGVVTTDAHSLDIDHFVPLQNAWISGAWAWSSARLHAYANDLRTPDFLLAIPAHENRSKGDQSPDTWRPPARSSWCRYARDWDQIKAKYGLTVTPSEWAAVTAMASTCT